MKLKSVGSLTKPHKAQVLNYLNAANKEIGLLVNFGETSLKWERITKFKNQENR
ncbi:MAG: GxxExxY protein [Treponema sp.]|nr:GxxExxY protein [Treponema sp.]